MGYCGATLKVEYGGDGLTRKKGFDLFVTSKIHLISSEF